MSNKFSSEFSVVANYENDSKNTSSKNFALFSFLYLFFCKLEIIDMGPKWALEELEIFLQSKEEIH